MVKQCCVCRKVKRQDDWVKSNIMSFQKNEVSHGYCPECFTEVVQKLDASVRSNNIKFSHA